MDARRIPLPEAVRAADAFPDPDYSSAFELPILDVSSHTSRALYASRTPEQWARAVFEDAPRPIRWFVRTGWRFPLRFDLAPSDAPDQVLGCRIIRNDGTTCVIEQQSPLMTAHNVVVVDPARIVWATLVRFRHPIARPLWAMAAPIHHRMLPYLLARATPARL